MPVPWGSRGPQPPGRRRSGGTPVGAGSEPPRRSAADHQRSSSHQPSRRPGGDPPPGDPPCGSQTASGGGGRSDKHRRRPTGGAGGQAAAGKGPRCCRTRGDGHCPAPGRHRRCPAQRPRSGGRARARRRATGLNGGQRRHGRQGPEPGPRARRPDEAYLPGLVLGGVRQPGGVERTTTLHSPLVFIDH